MTDDPKPAPPGAIPAEKLLPGLRGHLQKGEHVLWQGRGSGRALSSLSRALFIRLSLLAIASAFALYLLLENSNPEYNWFAWVLLALLAARVGWYLWQTSATPSRQVAMLTTERLVAVDILRPASNWIVAAGGEGRADGKHMPPQPIVITGTKARGNVRVNHAPQNARAYPPFVLFNPENPVQLAERIKKVLRIDQPIEDRTK